MGSGTGAERHESPDLSDRAQAIEEAKDGGEEDMPNEAASIKYWATWVSVVAAAFSIAVAVYSTTHGWVQERHAKRLELTQMIGKLVELQENPKTDEGSIVLGKLAIGLIDELSPDVSGPEYSIVARALLTGGNVALAKTYAQKAVVQADTTGDKTWALRQLAWILIQSGAYSEGDSTYNKALNVFPLKDQAQVPVKNDQAATYVYWTQVSALMGRHDKACELFNEAQKRLKSGIFPEDKKNLQAVLKDVKEQSLKDCPERE
jgi:tetratricopeptide (TPR) repeat protein